MWKFARKVLFFILLIMTLTSSMADGRDYTMRRKIDGYTMDISINRNPPIIGKNNIRIEIKDPFGKDVINTPVTVNYYMPPMPGMPPMNYTVQAPPRSSGYEVAMDFIMTGPWNIVVKANIPGKPLRMTVPVDVR